MDVGLAAPDSLKSTCMSSSEVEGEDECAAITRGEPASAQHITGWCSEIPRDLNSVPEDNGTAAGKDLTGVRQRNSQRAPPPRVLIVRVTRHATSRVTFCHAKVKS